MAIQQIAARLVVGFKGAGSLISSVLLEEDTQHTCRIELSVGPDKFFSVLRWSSDRLFTLTFYADRLYDVVDGQPIHTEATCLAEYGTSVGSAEGIVTRVLKLLRDANTHAQLNQRSTYHKLLVKCQKALSERLTLLSKQAKTSTHLTGVGTADVWVDGVKVKLACWPDTRTGGVAMTATVPNFSVPPAKLAEVISLARGAEQ